HYFSEGNDITIPTADYPGDILTFVSSYFFVDSLYVDDRFEMYVVYFTGDPQNPWIQRPLGKLEWNWGGLVVFDWDWNVLNSSHKLRYTNTIPGLKAGQIFPPSMQNMASMVTMQGLV